MTIWTFDESGDGERVVGPPFSCPGIAVSTLRKGHLILLDSCRLAEMLKGAKPRIGFLDTALAGGFVQVDPAAGTEAAALGPAEGLKRQIQQDVLTQEPRKVEAIVRQDIHIHLRSGQLDRLAPKGLLGAEVQDHELVRYWNRDRFGASAARDYGSCREGPHREDAISLALEMERGLDRGERNP